MAAVNQNDPRSCYTCGMRGHVQRHCPQNLLQETLMQRVSRWDPRGPGRSAGGLIPNVPGRGSGYMGGRGNRGGM
eukprot:798523-Rhodomonas_salina.1